MAHNFFTPGKRSLAVIDEMVNDKYPEPLIHEGKNLKKTRRHSTKNKNDKNDSIVKILPSQPF